MSYQRLIQVEFNHCDPAGIVFYPRYFEMTNSVIENFFAERLGRSFAQITLRDKGGVPTVRINADFRAPSHLGDILEFTLKVGHIGRTSAELLLTAAVGPEVRIEVYLTLVWITPDGRAAPWPEDVRKALAAEMNEGNRP